jgi:formylglycine-generating enzyme required for sulfatase activity
VQVILYLLLLTIQSNFENYTQTIQGSDLGFDMVAIRGGSFYIGSESGDSDEMPKKKVVVSDFWMAKTETTYDLFQLYLDQTKEPEPRIDAITRPSPPYIDFTLGMGKNGGFPANSMQAFSAHMFCKWLYEKTGVFYRLPTEAEWEYVAQRSYDEAQITDSAYLVTHEWIAANSGDKYHKTATLQPNKLGIYDLLGNVAEWTMDQYSAEYYSTIKDGTIDPYIIRTKKHPTSVRGGHYKSSLNDIRPSNRTASDPIWNRRDPQLPKSKWWNTDAPFIGFRVVRPAKSMSKEEVYAFFEANLK